MMANNTIVGNSHTTPVSQKITAESDNEILKIGQHLRLRILWTRVGCSVFLHTEYIKRCVCVCVHVLVV